MKAYLLPAIVIVAALPGSAQSELPTWTAADGRKIQARFIRLASASVVIEKEGTPYAVPFARLSQSSVDQAWKLAGRTDPAPKVAEIAAASPPSPPPIDPSRIRLEGAEAIPPAGVPDQVVKAVAAGNVLQTKGYKYGGGRDPLEDWGYDCSGSVSYVLIKAGLLDEPRTSTGFTSYGLPGEGRWITVFAAPGHVYITLCGLRLDTGAHGGERGPRWGLQTRYDNGYAVRHPPGM